MCSLHQAAPCTFDSDLPPPYSFCAGSQLNIHEIDKSIDNVFRRAGDPKVEFLQAITAGQNTDMPQYKIYIRAERECGSQG